MSDKKKVKIQMICGTSIDGRVYEPGKIYEFDEKIAKFFLQDKRAQLPSGIIEPQNKKGNIPQVK